MTAVLAALFAIALGAVVYLRVFYAPQTTLAPAPEQLRLEAVHREGNLEITWDTRSLGKVKEGQLDIQDGPIKARLLLDARTLSGGSVSYAYKSDVTGFRLHVQRKTARRSKDRPPTWWRRTRCGRPR